jgi:hypothetical protein
LTRSAADIISLSTGRESLLIGPPSAFGVQSRDLVIRDRLRARAVLELFLTRPHADQLLRPHLRRWGFDPVALQYSDRARMLEQLARAVSGGSLALAVVPEVTLAFAAAQDRPPSVRPAPFSAPRPHLPDSLQERMVLVLEMVPDHLQGEMLLAFKNAVDGRMKELAIGVVAWLGAHFVPGLNLAVIAFDLFCLPGEVIQALETLGTVIRDVRNAGSLDDLKPSARLMAAAIATLIAEGVLGRLLKNETHAKGVGKAGGHPDRKPSRQKTPQRQVEPRQPRAEGGEFTERRLSFYHRSTGKEQPESNTSKGLEKGAEKIIQKDKKQAAAKAVKEKAVKEAPEAAGKKETPQETGGKGVQVSLKTRPKSLREKYLGKTPGKNSKTGKEVRERTRTEGTLRTNRRGKDEFLDEMGVWRPVDSPQTHMGHNPMDAVDYWNSTGRFHGAKSAEVRAWMLNSDNYRLEWGPLNSARGGASRSRYLPAKK